MGTEPFLLTIAIPTYNRSQHLARLLESLLPQLKREPRVELIVSDNASPDETPATVEQFRLRGLVFRSIRKPANIGAEANFVQCFNEARGRYVWIVGDDDVVLPGCLEAVLGLLQSGDFDLVHLRAKAVADGVEREAPTRRPRIEIVRDPATFARRAHVYLTFITSNIIDKRRVSQLPHEPFTNILGTGLVQLSWTFTALRHLRKGAVVHDRLIAGGGDENRAGYSLVTIFGTNLNRVAEAWLGDPALVRILLNGTLQVFFPSYVFLLRRGGSVFLNEDPDRILRPLFGGNLRYWIFIYPLLRLPMRLGRIWLFLCRVVNRLDKSLCNPLLR